MENDFKFEAVTSDLVDPEQKASETESDWKGMVSLLPKVKEKRGGKFDEQAMKARKQRKESVNRLLANNRRKLSDRRVVSFVFIVKLFHRFCWKFLSCVVGGMLWS